ncbi:MAG: hypothetical protein HY289_12760, partial [Planctomycetes bacterium]|nr:hypothetical protein [Planctomycetota bacterium]
SNTDNGSKHPFSGTWKATGNSMYMELHAKYYEFRGILAGNILAGDSANTAGLRWKTSFRRAGFAK